MSHKAVCIAVLLSALLVAVLRPPRVHALSTEDAIYIAVGGVVAYVAVVYIGTKLAFPREGQLLLPNERGFDRSGEFETSRLRIGPACRTPEGQPALICW